MHLAGSGGELTLRERAAWGAFAGLMSGVFTGAVRALGGGLYGLGVPAGWVWSSLSAAMVGTTLAVVAGDRSYAPPVMACGGIMLGCLGVG